MNFPVILILAGALYAEAPVPDIAKLSEEVRQLQAEIRELKRSVAQIQLERQTALVGSLEAELQQVAESLARIDLEDAERLQSVRETEEHLNSPGLSDEQRVGSQSLRAALLGSRFSVLNKQRQVLFEREALLRRRLGEERQRLENRLPVRR